jgi:large subunit ribosomal protein L28
MLLVCKQVFRLDLGRRLAYTQPSFLNAAHLWLLNMEPLFMAKRCQISGKTVMSGNNVSHANNRTRRRFLPNLQSTRMHSEALDRQISLRVSTSAMRTVEKHGGLDAYLLQARNAELAVEARELKRKITAAKLAE